MDAFLSLVISTVQIPNLIVEFIPNYFSFIFIPPCQKVDENVVGFVIYLVSYD